MNKNGEKMWKKSGRKRMAPLLLASLLVLTPQSILAEEVGDAEDEPLYRQEEQISGGEALFYMVLYTALISLKTGGVL